MNLAALSQEELLARCAWCHRHIPKDQECFGSGLRVRPERRAEIIAYRGRAVPLQLATGREIIVMVVPPDSQAGAAGDDLYVQICSEKCGQEIDRAVRDEIT